MCPPLPPVSFMFQHVYCPNTETFCYPGPEVLHNNSVLHEPPQDNPSTSSMVTHVGSDNIKLSCRVTLIDTI